MRYMSRHCPISKINQADNCSDYVYHSYCSRTVPRGIEEHASYDVWLKVVETVPSSVRTPDNLN